MGNSSGDLREFLRNAEALKRQTVQKQQKNLTEEPEEYRDARRKAMRLLEHMDRTEKGLREKLRQAGFTSQAVDHALTYVEAYGYIDDERYARTYIAYRMDTKSRQKIIRELMGKGIDRKTAIKSSVCVCFPLASTPSIAISIPIISPKISLVCIFFPL